MWRLSAILLLCLGVLQPPTSTRAEEKDKKEEKKPAPKGDLKTIEGLDTNQWEPKEVTVKPGDIVEWRVKGGFHGVIFQDWDKAKKVLKVDEKASLKIEPQKGFPAPAQGTKGAGSGVLVRATVLDIPADMKEIPYICTIHKAGMSGKLVLAGEKPKRERPTDR